MSGKQINPLFIQALTGKPITQIPASPTFKHLGGKYVKSIVDQLKKVSLVFSENKINMTCKNCGKKYKYNIGTICVDVEKDRNMQLTGYFRCKNCNSAGQWEDSSELYMYAISALISPNRDELPVHFGQLQLFDGTCKKYASDGEEHLLSLIAASPDNALLWNKLGNLYYSGARPELAMAAFEKSIAIDPKQIESHLSIGNLLGYVGDFKNAIYHLQQVMLYAEHYEALDANSLRELVANAICNSFIASTESKMKYQALPTREQVEAANCQANLNTAELIEGIELSSEDITTFYPLAEGFMGIRALELK